MSIGTITTEAIPLGERSKSSSRVTTTTQTPNVSPEILNKYGVVNVKDYYEVRKMISNPSRIESVVEGRPITVVQALLQGREGLLSMGANSNDILNIEHELLESFNEDFIEHQKVSDNNFSTLH